MTPVQRFELALHARWRIFKAHAPVGAYLPVGQLDGDCKTCGGSWPCPPWFSALKESQQEALQ